MGAGFQVFDEVYGNIIIDTSTLVGRLIANIDASAASGSVAVQGLDMGVPFAIPIMQQADGQYSGAEGLPRCTFSGNTVSWTRQPGPVGSPAQGACTLILGVR